jgi:SagB-type dehydrogenase family enzyme
VGGDLLKTTGQDFMKGTYRQFMSESPQKLGMPQPPLELPLPQNAELILLPTPTDLDIPAIDLRKAIEQRRSQRSYTDEALTLAELSWLLWLTQGIKEVTDRPSTLRTVPSAGARHAFETYLLINRVIGIQPGLYRFAAGPHALVKLDMPSNIRELVTQYCGNQKQIYNSAVTFLWVAILERMAWRYVERGYRYLHLDAGHVCQNLYLAAEAIQCGVCAIGAFDDEKINSTLGLDGEEQFVIYVGSVGKRE